MLTGSGLEVEGIELFESIKGGLEGVVIGEVMTCEKHPNADKLSKTTVDIGDQIVPIVCGAPNVAKGQKVVVATEGCTLYPISGDPFEIKKAKIRGEVSQGMICAEDEIGIGESHAGIMVLDTDLPNGTPAAEYFKVTNGVFLGSFLTIIFFPLILSASKACKGCPKSCRIKLVTSTILLMGSRSRALR